MEQTEQIAQRADRAEKAALEKAPDQDKDHREAACEQADLQSCKDGRQRDRRTEIAEIAADESQSQHQKEHRPADRDERAVHAVVHCDPFSLGPAPDQVHEILYKPHRTQETADHTAKEQSEAGSRYEEKYDVAGFKSEELIKVGQIITAALRQLAHVDRAGKNGDGNACVPHAQKDPAEDHEKREQEHGHPSHGHENGELLPRQAPSRCFGAG